MIPTVAIPLDSRHGAWASPSYELQLAANEDWAMDEASRFFDERSGVHRTLREIAARLDQLGIPYAVCGGIALFHHGLRRFTEDVDLLVTSEGLKRIHEELEGRGYVPPFSGSRNLRDVDTGVRIEFLVAGQFPGDGRPKPVAFPDPEAVSTSSPIRFLTLPALIELKLASGMTSVDRRRDLADVQELIRLLSLPRDFSRQLHEYVRAHFEQLWVEVFGPTKRYIRPLPPPVELPPGLDHAALVERLFDEYPEIRDVLAAGVAVEADESRGYGWLQLVTTDADLARQFELHDEGEYLSP